MGKFYLEVFYNKTELNYNDICIIKGVLIDLWRKQISIHSMERIRFICNYLILRFFPNIFSTVQRYYSELLLLLLLLYNICLSHNDTALFYVSRCFVFRVICFMQRAMWAFTSDLDRLLLVPKAASRWCYGAGRLKLDRLLIRQRK